MVKITTFLFFIGLVVVKDIEHFQCLYVKTTFVHADLDEEIYMDQPECFVSPSQEHLVSWLKKILYNLNLGTPSLILKIKILEWHMRWFSYLSHPLSGLYVARQLKCWCASKTLTTNAVDIFSGWKSHNVEPLGSCICLKPITPEIQHAFEQIWGTLLPTNRRLS